MLFFLCPRHTSLQPLLPGGSGEGAGAPLLLLPSFQIFQLEHRLSSGLCCFLRSSYASTTQRLKRGTGALHRSRVVPRAPFCQLLLPCFKSCQHFSLCSTWS